MKPMLDVHHRRHAMVEPSVLAVLVLFAGSLFVDLLSGSVPTAQGADGHYSGKQGHIIVVKVPTDDATARVQGKFLGRSVRFFLETRRDEPKGFIGLLGIDLQDEPGTHELVVEMNTADQSRTLMYRVTVVKEKFHVEHLTLPKDKVDLDDKAVARWKAEQEQVKAALGTDSQAK
ncbi:MAG: hypothetical protein ABL950_15045, partial [Nitrospira sp.]